MKKRIQELDILRGLSVFGMILVITPGDWSHRFSWLNHAEWRGFPLSDMIFPTFLFCVGMSISISITKQKIDNTKIFKRIIHRFLLLILIGIFLNGFPYFDWQNLRIPGVLQRIGLCYLLVATFWGFVLYKNVKFPLLWLISITILLLLGYFILLYCIPVPNIGINGTSSTNSWPLYIDQHVFGINHLWIYGTSDGIVTYDPEGILASLPACGNVFLGLIVGIMRKKYSHWYKSIYILFLGLMILVFGFILDFFEIMPIIKKIWTSSFVLLSGGFSIILLALIILLYKNVLMSKSLFYPFMVYGSNALLAFIVSTLLMSIMDMPLFINEASIRLTGFQFFLNFGIDGQWASFMYSIVFLSLLFLGLQYMYKQKYFVKI